MRIQTSLSGLLLASLLLLGGCAASQSGGPAVKVFEKGEVRLIPQACFNEQRYLARGFVKNTTADGSPIYVLIPETDQKKDITFLGGEGGGYERSFGGREGQFTGKTMGYPNP